MLKKFLCGIAATVLVSTSAHAAVLSASGAVQVNRGGGFRTVTGTVNVNPGDRILVGPGGNAQLT